MSWHIVRVSRCFSSATAVDIVKDVSRVEV
jgi:hypothetical protein